MPWHYITLPYPNLVEKRGWSVGRQEDRVNQPTRKMHSDTRMLGRSGQVRSGQATKGVRIEEEAATCAGGGSG